MFQWAANALNAFSARSPEQAAAEAPPAAAGESRAKDVDQRPLEVLFGSRRRAQPSGAGRPQRNRLTRARNSSVAT